MSLPFLEVVKKFYNGVNKQYGIGAAAVRIVLNALPAKLIRCRQNWLL